MKYRLGLDLGVGSIGSAIIKLDEKGMPENIQDAGVRIFTVSEGAENRRLKRAARKNLIRTKKRLELLAKKLFENDLWINENPEGTDKLKSKSPYKIRNDALNEKLKNQNYIGRAILHMAKHRGAGFVNASEGWEDEILDNGETSKKKASSYDKMLEYMKKFGARTLGEYFYKLIFENYRSHTLENGGEKPKNVIRQKVYNGQKAVVDYAIPRYLVKDEFHKIWDKQAEYFSQMNKEGLKQEVYDILFFERPAAPYAIGKCSYIRDEDRLSKAHPLSEMRRIYEEVNNIRIISDTGKRSLTVDERDKIIDELLLKGKSAGKQAVKALFGLSGQQKVSIFEEDDKKAIKAYLYSRPEFAEVTYIKSLSDEEFEKFIEFLANPVNPEDKSGRLYNEDELVNHLKKLLKVKDEKKIEALLTKLPKGRVMLGKTASQTLLAKMKEKVIAHREACDDLAKTDVRFMAEEENARRMQGKYRELPYYGEILRSDTAPLPPLMVKNNKDILSKEEIKYGKIANPAVHMILNQLRLVVNEIIKIYGKPYEINIELGRDVGLSTKKKNQKEFEKRANEKLNDAARKYLSDHRMFISGKNILKYKLAEEQGWRDAYNPQAGISQLFEGMEIEHIIPRAKGGSHAYSNLCLVNRTDNLNKGDDFAYDYLSKAKRQEELTAILKYARERLPQNKAWRFEADAREKFEDKGDDQETSRYLTDTRYVAKMSQRYLRAIVDTMDFERSQNRILSVKGAQTAQLRKKWYLDGLEYDLMGLDIPKYVSCNPYWVEQGTGEVIDGASKPDVDGNWRFYDKAKNKEWFKKPRIDHRHHAMDAITVACANRSLIQKMAHETDMKKLEYPLPMTCVESSAGFRRRVFDVLRKVNVSHKPNHTTAGQFHEETGKRMLCRNPDDKDFFVTVYSRKILQVIKSMDDLMKLIIPETIKNEWHKDIEVNKAKQAKLVADFKLFMDEAKQALVFENEQAVAEGKKSFNMTEGRIIFKTFKIIQEKGLWKGNKFKNYENSSSLINISKHGVAYKSGNNHRIDFYEKDDKVGWEVINRFNANKKDFVPEWREPSGKALWVIQQGDVLELNTPEEWEDYTDEKRCLARVKNFSEGKIAIDYMSDARMTSPKDKDLKYMFVHSLKDRGLRYLTQKRARKIELTPFGRIKKKHKALWYGKKPTS
ncbi:MAG: type II CRISPR RNA-guided endonuclease Cas9 [Lactobacillales bacterium]|jgi:CRISPR-associated endonuclease Csn1|nr:type II CRISPR RNA-guided endonuclease Cas9 [Lactobacillales bacterium]